MSLPTELFQLGLKFARASSNFSRRITDEQDPVVIEKILTHLQEKLTSAPAGLRPESRAQPVDLFG